MWRQHDELIDELEAARVAYEEADAQRDENRNPRLEDTLNTRYLQANNRLARASREHNVYIDEVDDIGHLSTFTRHYSPRPEMLLADRVRSPIPTNLSLNQTTLQAHTDTFQTLERERQDLVTSDTINRLSEHVAYIEHLNTALTETLYQRQQDIAMLSGDLDDAQTLLDEYVVQIDTATEIVAQNRTLREEAEILQDAVAGAVEEAERLGKVVREMGRVEGDLWMECEISRAKVRELRSRGRGDSRGLGIKGVDDGGGDGEDEGGVKLEDNTEVMDRMLVDVVERMSPCVPAHKATAMYDFEGLQWI